MEIGISIKLDERCGQQDKLTAFLEGEVFPFIQLHGIVPGLKIFPSHLEECTCLGVG